MISAAIERCAGVDVGKKFLAVCILVGPLEGEPRMEKRRYGTTMAELEELREWLRSEGITHAVMESTGSYWKVEGAQAHRFRQLRARSVATRACPFPMSKTCSAMTRKQCVALFEVGARAPGAAQPKFVKDTSEAFLCRGPVWRVTSECSRSALKKCSSFPVTQQIMPTGKAVLIPSPSTE